MPSELLDLTPLQSALLLADLERWEARQLSLVDWGRRFLPAHCHAASAPFHEWLNTTLAKYQLSRGQKTAIIAPRHSAKSTWITLAYVLRCALEGTEPYIVILSDTGDQAADFISPLREAIEESELIQEVYPSARMLKGGGMDRIRFANGTLIRGFGRGNKVRGRKKGANRPTLIVIDDCQSNEDITSQTLRESALNWFLGEVVPAGALDVNFLSVGSALHRDAVSVRAQTLPGWTGRTWPALEAWPDRLDLWQQWELLATNLTDENRVATAAAFLDRHRAAMQKGAVSYWPAYWPIERLMGRRAEIGPRRFLTEYQGVALSPEGTEWPPEYFDRKDLWFDEWPQWEEARRDPGSKAKPPGLVYVVVALDPSKGQKDTPGDYQAHVVVGMDSKGGLWCECDCRREPVPEMVARSVELARIHRPHCVAVETNQGLDLLIPEFQRQAQLRKLLVPLQDVLQVESKAFRIRRLDSYLSRHQIRVRNTPGGRILVEQLREFPLGDHDDAPDALELGIRRLELLAAGM